MFSILLIYINHRDRQSYLFANSIDCGSAGVLKHYSAGGEL